MRSIVLIMLTIAGISSNAFAEKALVLNCVSETSEAYVVKTLQEWTMVPAGGVEVRDLQTGIAKAQTVLASGSMDTLIKAGNVLTVINSAKIVRIDTNGGNYKQVCAILEGEVFQRSK